MTTDRHNTIGIKQALQYAWMERAANLLLAGLDAKAVRKELHSALTERQLVEGDETRSAQTRTFAVNNLMNIWVSPDPLLIPFRDAALHLLRHDSSQALPIHWAMVCAVYPFWFNVARQTGRLLALQDQITQAQVVNRLKEQYGDRPTISRYARYVLRSFVSWGVLKDTDSPGRYEANGRLQIEKPEAAVLLLEAALHAEPEGKAAVGLLQNTPAFFPFSLPLINGVMASHVSSRLDVARFGLDDEFLKLK